MQRIAIVGGGTAGWMAAAALSKVLPSSLYEITLIESAQISTVGVGEATIPPIESFNKLIGVDRQEFLQATNGTFKLGIEFINWGNTGESYYHPFGAYGKDFNNLPFFQHWQRARADGFAKDLASYSLNVQMCEKRVFSPAQNIPDSPLSKIQQAYHFDAGLYAKYLRKIAESNGVNRIEGKVLSATQNNDTGYIESLILENNPNNIHADFYIDCSGFQGLLIEKTLGSGYESWKQYLPCDSAKAVPCKKMSPAASHTKAIAHGYGWQWKIPLQSRIGNGLVYSSDFWSDDSAEQTLLNNLEGLPMAEVKQLRFTPGKRKQQWKKNCVAIGLSSGFLEPLESTSIHLIQSAISKLIAIFPNFDQFEAEQRRFNKLMDEQIDAIRDFIILHYKATNREDTEFWKYCRNMEIPESLKEKIELYEESGHLGRDNNELFSEYSWISVFEGQGVKCKRFIPIAQAIDSDLLDKQLKNIEHVVNKCASKMESHQDFLDKYCKSTTM